MKFDLYCFEYRTKSKDRMLISYGAVSLHSAYKKFMKNTHSTKLYRVWKKWLFGILFLKKGVHYA